MLRKAGYRPLLAESGQHAIDLMREESLISSVAAVLCDLEMPGMDGFLVCQALRNEPVTVYGCPDGDFSPAGEKVTTCWPPWAGPTTTWAS